jgi:hypothetical protein
MGGDMFILPINKGRKQISFKKVRSQILTVASVKMIVFGDVAPCSLVEVYRRYTL